MADATRAEVYPQRLSHSPVVRGLGCVTVLMLPTLLTSLVVLHNPAYALPLVLAWAVGIGLERRAVQLDESGLTELFWVRGQRHIEWSEVQSVSVEPSRVHVRSTRGPLLADARVERWVRLGRRIADRLSGGRRASECQGEVAPETVAAWLGIEPGQRLECGVPRSLRVREMAKLVLLPILNALLFAFGATFPDESGGWIVVGSFGVFFVWLSQVGKARRRGRWCHVSAGVDGLSIKQGGGRTCLDWGELHSLRPLAPEEQPSAQEPGWLVTHETGSFRVYEWHQHAAQLIAAVRLAIDAQIRGQRLPGLGPISEAAISLTRSADDTAERGLSRPEE